MLLILLMSRIFDVRGFDKAFLMELGYGFIVSKFDCTNSAAGFGSVEVSPMEATGNPVSLAPQPQKAAFVSNTPHSFRFAFPSGAWLFRSLETSVSLPKACSSQVPGCLEPDG